MLRSVCTFGCDGEYSNDGKLNIITKTIHQKRRLLVEASFYIETNVRFVGQLNKKGIYSTFILLV